MGCPISIARCSRASLLKMAWLGLLATLGMALTVPAMAMADAVRFNISAQPLPQALKAFAAQAHMQLLYQYGAVANARGNAVVGDLDKHTALDQLLKNSGLEVIYSSESAATIRPKLTPTGNVRSEDPPLGGSESPQPGDSLRLAQANSGQAQTDSSVNPSTVGPAKKEQQAPVVEEVVVTGTYIHNVDPITPVTTITSVDIQNQGYTNLSDVIQQLPQNFKAGASQESNTMTQVGAGAANNETFASGPNLLGLGANATLTLLNGHRLAPTALGGVVDITAIPVDVIDRVEILTDGASALYGSDAVAGVVNIITKKDFSGLEIGARSTSIAEGKAPNYGANALGGTSWSGGNLVMDFDYEKDNPLYTRNRTFSDTALNPTALFPENETGSLFASLTEALTDSLSLSVDLLGSQRKFSADLAFVPSVPSNHVSGKAEQFSGSGQLDYKLSSTWTATLAGSFSKENDTDTFVYGNEANLAYQPVTYKVASVEPRLDGKLFDGPGGAVQLAVGGQYRNESLDYATENGPKTGGPLTVTDTAIESRHITSGYAELLIPFVGRDNAVPLVERLRLDLSGRYDDYSDFGHTTNPKIALEWVPVTGFSTHASWSKSFQAPTLYAASNDFSLAYAWTIPDPQAASGASRTLIYYGTNPNLQPETARNITAGFTLEPIWVKGLKIDANFFSVNFDNQISFLAEDGYFTNVLQQEAALGSFVERNPTAAQVEQIIDSPGRQTFDEDAGGCQVGTPGCAPINPASIKALANIGYVNASSVVVRGIDLIARYVSPATSVGTFRGDFDTTFYTTYQQSLTPGSAEASPLNTAYNPLKFRAKANFGWDEGPWHTNLRLNYANAYDNTDAVNSNCPAPVGCRISSWTTVDFNLAFQAPVSRSSALSGTRVSLSVSNLFNRPPPFVPGTENLNINYDPVNASALMRAFAITVTKRFGGAPGRQ